MEFEVSGLPEGATIRSATLDFEINQRQQSGSVVPIVAAYGYQADGPPTDAEARDLSRFLGQSAPIQSFDPISIPLNVAQLSSMIATSPQIGIIAYEAVPNVGVSIVASQLADQFPTIYSPPTLTIGYSIDSYPAQAFPTGDYNRNGNVDAADYVVWRKSLGTQGNSPADGDGDGDVDPNDYGVWVSRFGQQPDDEVPNGGFQSGNLSGWNIVVEPNTDVSFGFPRVESFDVDGDGQANGAMRVRLGRSDTDLFGGSVSIEQQLLLAEGDYIFSAGVASHSLDTGGNTGPGNYLLSFDGQIVDQVMLNGTSISPSQVIRDSLEATLTNVEAGYHTLRLTVARGAVNSRAIYQFIDNIQFTSAALASTQAVPEPSAIALLGIALALAASRRRRRSRLSRGTRDVNAAQSKIDVRWMIIARRAR
ncbi:MAG TPA: PEP-CTERM sorting domain-containing protein [Lacipirellulaceae bacterium]|nr:PEP-CTERM sorting domain-containing protein [Lacipirellulaceae bacterium]